jgi:hypothetical protein
MHAFSLTTKIVMAYFTKGAFMKNGMTQFLRTLGLVCLLTAGGLRAQAGSAPRDYTCLSADKNAEAQLTFNVDTEKDNALIFWKELTYAAQSKGTFEGYEQAPYQTRNGYLRYNLVNYYSDLQQRFILEIDPGVERLEEQVQVLMYFVDKGIYTAESKYNCTLLPL